ncbi:hypothetical protein FXB39_17010 [Nocardioides sp. BGMRC 2183]|nr:hypothetical protein FXB39_17010 [Nocardioides sp. BGMRC 2183]
MSRRALTTVAALALTAPLLGLASATPVHAEDRTGPSSASSDGPAITGHPDEITVERTRTTARRGGTFTAYPVPTSGADLGRITTAPDGSMWFVEEDANKVARITTRGVITEYVLPETTTGEGVVYDLDVDAAGRVWVVWDTGWKVSRFDPAAPQNGYTWEFDYPYGEEVRVGPDAVWVTVSYDEDGIVRIAGNNATWAANAPECDGALGRGRDGLMWCQEFDNLIRVNAGGTGGTTFPLPDDATYPYSVATGPNQKIWFGRDGGGTMFTSPSRGNIGWVTANNKVQVRRLGDRTAPRSLTTGKDGNVWFTSVGSAKGIGHLNPKGQGAVVKVGNYQPTALTYGSDGAIWFTDADHNTVVRVARQHLWVTNVDLGARSQLAPHPQPRLQVKGKRLDADKRRRKATTKVSCGKGGYPCQGKATVTVGRRKVGTGSYVVPARRTAKVNVKLNAAARAQLKRRPAVAAVLVLKSAAGKVTRAKVRLTR